MEILDHKPPATLNFYALVASRTSVRAFRETPIPESVRSECVVCAGHPMAGETLFGRPAGTANRTPYCDADRLGHSPRRQGRAGYREFTRFRH